MPRDLAETIRNLSPGALSLFKRQLAGLPESERQRAFGSLANIPELADIVGRPAPTPERAPAPRPTRAESDIPFWMKGLETVTAPFRFIEEKITTPFAAAVTAPWTRGVTGTEGKNWLEREIAEYKQAELPSVGLGFDLPEFLGGHEATLGVKGALELLPWLAIPSAAGIAGRLGVVAARGGAVGRGAVLARKAIQPAVKAERALTYPIAKPLEKLAARRAAKAVPEAAVQTGKPFAATVYRGKYDPKLKTVLGDEAAYGKDPYGYWATDERVAMAYATGDPTQELSVAALKTQMKEVGGKILTKEVNLQNPYVMTEGVEDKFLAGVVSRAGRKAELAGKDMVAQNEAASQAIVTSLRKKGHDGLVVQRAEGYAEVIPYTKEALKPISKVAPIVERSPIEESRAVLAGTKLVGLQGEGVYALGFPKYKLPKELGSRIEAGGEYIFLKSRTKEANLVIDKIEAAYTKRQGATTSKEVLALDTEIGRLFGYSEAEIGAYVKGARAVKEVAEPPVKPPIKPPVGTAAVPDGFDQGQQEALTKLVEMVKRSKPIRRETETLYKQEQAARIDAYRGALEKYTKQGVGPEEANSLAIRELSGRYPQADIPAEIASLRAGMTEAEVGTLFGVVRDAVYKSDFTRINTFTALQDLLLGKVIQRHQIGLLEDTFGSILAGEILKKHLTLGAKVGQFTLDIANAPRALLASCDISGLLRQGGVLSAAHPIEAVRTVKPMLQAFFSDRNEGIIDSIIRARPHFALAEESGLYMAPRVGQVAVRLAEREEAFMSSIMAKVPFVRASNRAYVTGLNDIRTRIWEKTLTQWEQAGIKVIEKDYKDLAQFINWASGRGTLYPKSLQQQGALLNTMLFSPRLILSRIELPLSILPGVTKSALVRREAMKTLTKATALGASILAMAKMSGATDLVLDPRSADFGKMRVGETRLDIWTGYVQYIRFAAQLAAGQKKSASGRVYSANRKEILDRFAQSKLSPAVGLINDMLKGETYLGEELPPKSTKSVLGQMYQRMMPLAIQDLIDGVEQDGVTGGIVSSVGLLGIGVVTYTDEVRKARDKAAQAQYGMDWDEVGLKYGRAAQLQIEQQSTAIQEAEKEREVRFSTGTPTLMEQWQSEGQAVEDTYREAIEIAAKEFRQTGDGVRFRDKVDQAASTRRQMYSSRQRREEYAEITNYYNQPISEEQAAKMNPGDIIRREYNQQMYGADMYDEFGNYRFDVADQKETEFLKMYGQGALDYIEEYRGSRWLNKPPELRVLEDSREMLRAYWKIADQIWSLYPPELKAISDQVRLMERTDPERARQFLKRYPAILRARDLIAKFRKQMRTTNPAIDRAYRIFYS